MNTKIAGRRRTCLFLLLVVWSLLVSLAVCQCASAPEPVALVEPLPTSTWTATATPAPTLTPVPAATNTATPTPTPVPVPELKPWQMSNDYVTWDQGSSCAQGLPDGAFVLGLDPATCAPGARGGSAVASLTIPPAQGRQVIVLRLACTGEEGCARAAADDGQAGEITIAVDGQVLWRARCDLGQCDALALSQEPAVAFLSAAPSEPQIRLAASPHTTLSISGLRVEWQPMPTLLQGIAYSPFRDCQNPHWGPYPDDAQVREDLMLVRQMGNAIRTYSTTEGQERIPALARELDLRVSAGAWLGRDRARNEAEIAALIRLAQEVDLESVIVGNEVLLRRDMEEDELIGYIERVQAAVDVPVTTAEIADVLLGHPRVMAAVDYHLIHLYGHWAGVPIEYAARYVVDEYHKFQAQAGGKQVVIGETGWPAAGPAKGPAVPSSENQRRFLREFLTLAQQESVEFYYFAGFDELWKTEGGVGPYWGIMYPDRRNKYDLQSVLIPVNDPVQPAPGLTPLPTGTPGPAIAEGDVFPIFTTYAAEHNHFTPSGWMGDIHAIHFTDCARPGEAWEDRVIEIRYAPSAADLEGWAGIYWLEPDSNWAVVPGGYDLSGFTRLRFLARSTVDGAEVKFLLGGVNKAETVDIAGAGDYPSSISTPVYAREAGGEGFVTLSTDWQEFHIDLGGLDLSHVIDGFGWVAERARTPDGVTVYLDEIVFDHEPPPPSPTPLPKPISSPAPLPAPTTAPDLVIYGGQTLAPGYNMGVDSSEHRHDWVTDMGGSMRMAYPPGQSWGAVYITVGPPAPPGQRQSRDLSAYRALAVDLRGEQDGEVVWIGVKDSQDLDDGRETKVKVTLTADWSTYTFPLSEFVTADLHDLYVPAEFVFEPGVGAETVYFRNVRYVAQP